MLNKTFNIYKKSFEGLSKDIWLLAFVMLINRSGSMVIPFLSLYFTGVVGEGGLEMSYFNAPINLYELLFEIQLKGYKPVLAHPERYNFYHHNFKEYYKLKTSGCLFQLNLLSLTEHYGKQVQKTAEKLLKEHMYDFAGTDVHHQNHLHLLQKIGTIKNLKNLESLLLNNTKFLKS